MTDNISDTIADRYTARAADLQRFSEHVRLRTLGYLEQLRIDLENEIRRVDPSAPALTKFKERRLKKLLDSVNDTIRVAYRDMERASREEIRPLVSDEARFAVSTLNGAVGVDIASVQLTGPQITALMSDTLIEGAPSAYWWRRQEGAMARRFADQMRQGVLRGETNAELVRRVRGTATGKRDSYWIDGKRKTFVEFSGGIMDTGTRQAEALVRSSVQAVSNAANYETLQANSDVVRGTQAVVTLDTRTTTICVARSSAVWDLKTGNPISGTTETFPGPPPWHWNCRTFLIPYLYTWETLRRKDLPAGTHKKILEIPQSTRASMNGQIAAGTSYEAWLKKQPKSVQLDKLGPGKYKLWTEDKLTFTDLINQRGRPLTVKELEAKYD